MFAYRYRHLHGGGSMPYGQDTPRYLLHLDKGVFRVFRRYKKAEAERMAVFVVEAKRSLLKKIQGYTVQERHITTVGSGKFDVNGKEIPRIKEQKVVDKHFQPDTAAIIFTLTNGEPENWKNRQNNEVTGKDGKDLFGQLSDEELDARIAELEKKLGK